MKILLLLLVVLAVSPAFAQEECRTDVIPKPNRIECREGSFTFGPKTRINATDDAGRRSAAVLNDLLKRNFGFTLKVTSRNGAPKRDTINFSTAATDGTDESYSLKVSQNGIEISANETGQFFAIQTLMQLLPVEFKGSAAIRAIEIQDKPRFKYRGMHLDVGRHFFPVSFVKKYIDLMSQYKFNYFHWHLTEDQGWRIEIKKYPRLTEIGSKRPETVVGRVLNPYRGDGIPVEGFYTQEQIKDIVAYAKARKITIVPEIDLPGHSSAALAAYPQFGCKPDYQYKVQTTWGIFKEVFCPTEETFKFLNDVLDEVIALFPNSPYIHIGGDEVLKDHWKESAYVQELMKRENLKDEHEVQSYFIRRLGQHVESRGKRFIGWDEILEGGLAPGAIVMSWRGMKGGIEAAKAKHEVIMTPTDYAYFDYGQGDPKAEPIHIGGYLPLEKVYSFEPVPADLTEEEKKYVIGAQGNVWTEYMKTPDKVEYMAFPRMLAMAETGWTKPSEKSFPDFQYRLAKHFESLDAQNVQYRIPEPRGLRDEIVTDRDSVRAEWEPLNRNAKIFYTLDGSEPTENSTEYKESFEVKLKESERVQPKLIVVLPNGRKSGVFSATFIRRALLDAVEIPQPKPGIRYSLFTGSFESYKELDKATPFETDVTRSIGLNQFLRREKNPQNEFWGVVFDGFIKINEDGLYEFQTDSDDGSALFIGDELVVDNDGAHALTTQSGMIPLKKGFHRIRVKFFQRGGEIGLNVRYGIKGRPLSRIGGGELFTR